MLANLENSAVATGLEKVSFHSNPKGKQCQKIALASHMLVKFCSKSFKLGFNSVWSKSFQMYKLDFKKAEETEIKLPKSIGS